MHTNYVCTQYYGLFIKHAELYEMDEKWLGRSYYWSGLVSFIIQV